MPRLFAAYLDRLDSAYRERPYFVGQKARLLAAFSLLMLVFTPFNAAKLIWTAPPYVELRLLFNLVFVATSAFCLHQLPRGRLERAGSLMALIVVGGAHGAIFLAPEYPQPLSLAIQLLILDIVFLLFSIVFATRRCAIAVFLLIVLGHVAFHFKALHVPSVEGTISFAADTLLRDGMVALGFTFILGITIAHMIETAHRRSEESLRQTRIVAENLEQLVSARTRDLESATQRATEASRAKSEFLANMSHEIRTPLNGIVASADLLIRRPDLTPPAAEQVRLVSQSGDLLLRLLGDILDFSKIEAGQLSLEKHAFELAPLITDTVALVAPKAALGAVRLDHAVEPRIAPFVEGDSYRLRQVLLNLLANAIKFTPPGGVVQVTVGAATDSVPHGIRFEIRDTGIGMDTATLTRVFERFVQADSSTTRRYGGTGLGLAISARLVEMMGGRLEAQSTPGVGSVFYFTLPLPAGTPVVDTHTPFSARDSRLGLRVLIAEDNTVNQKILAAQLTQLGCRHTTASDGEEALAALRTGPMPDVVLMDCHMPKLDGWEATRRIRAWRADPEATANCLLAAELPIVALTAAALPEERARCTEAGMNDFLSKPVKLAELHRALARFRTERVVD